MQVKQIWANLGVASLDQTTQFYTALGFTPNGTHGSGKLTSFLIGKENFVLNFFLNATLQKSLQGEVANVQLGNEILFTLGTETRNEIDGWAKKVVLAGGTLLSRPETFGDNYYGFTFADPDGHKFNFFYMEGM
jgi:predicted lactoylglutathione lyase